jgi:hypothetical protein
MKGRRLLRRRHRRRRLLSGLRSTTHTLAHCVERRGVRA